MVKKFFAGLIACTVMCSGVSVFASDGVNVFVNETPLSSRGVIIDGTTYVPVRAVTESLGANVSWDETTRSVNITMTEDDTVSKIIGDVSPSVVAIVGNYKPEYVSSAIYEYNTMTAHGTGVVIKSSGVILTNAHVVEKISNLTVVFSDGSICAGVVTNIDKTSDLALVKVDRLGLKPIKFGNMDSPQAGHSVIAIGNPLSLSMHNSATKGMISGVDVIVDGEYYPYLQFDAPINSGNSGGPLVNMAGELIGINSMKYTGNGVEGMSFAITLDTVNYVLNQFEIHGKVIRPDLGVTLGDSWEAKIGLPTSKGVTVLLSDRQDLTVGMEIVKINGKDVHSIVECNAVLRDTYKSGSISVTVKSGGTTKDILVTPSLKTE